MRGRKVQRWSFWWAATIRGWCLLGWLAASASAAEPGTSDYLRGLRALQQGQAAEAIAAFSAALEADEENADYFTARGVSHLLAEDLTRGEKDLERSLRLRPGHDETRMWLASAVAMSGDFGRDVTIYPAATHDQHESRVRLASREYGELAFRQSRGEAGDRERKMRAAAKIELARGAADFAALAKAAPGLGDAILSEAQILADGGDYAAALPDLAAALAGRPDDPDLLFQHGRCAMRAGDLTTAREELTRALTIRTDHAPSYLARALAAARLGDGLRARDDLSRAERLAPEESARARPEIEQALAALPADPPATAELFDALERAARQDAPSEQLVAQAEELRRVVNGRRRQHDEWCQDRLRSLEDALRAQPGNPDRLATLAKFLYEQSSVGRERVEPRGEQRLFRRQTVEMQRQEMARAESLADEALAIDPDHIQALTVKAAVGTWNGLYADAETIVRRALAKSPNSPELLELLAELLEVAAAQKSAEASNLRTPKYLGSSSETVGDYIYTYTYYRHPSLAERQEAERLDQDAQRCLDFALEQIERAARLLAGTAKGHYFQGLYHWKQGEIDQAVVSYEQAVKLDPQQVRWRLNLAGLYAAQGRYQDALEQRIAATRRVESSAALLLELCWDHVARTRWKTARETLRRAIALDAADARVPAYLGVVAAAADKPDEARAWFRVALALEEARLRQAGKSLDGDTPLAPSDYGLTMTLRARLGRLFLSLDRPAEAAQLCQATVALEPRVNRHDYPLEIPSAMLPDPDMDPNVVPVAEHVLVLGAWCRIVAGEALNRQKEYRQTIELLTPVEAFAPLLVNGRGADRLRGPELHSYLHLTRAYLALGDIGQASQYANRLPRKRFGAGPSLNPFAELEEPATALQQEIAEIRAGRRRVGDETSDDWQPADEETVNAVLLELGPRLGHPEMGDGSRRFAGDANEVRFCIQVQQAVTWIVSPKSTRWRSEIVTGLNSLQRSSAQYERYLEQSRARLNRQPAGARAAGQGGRDEELADLKARSGRVDLAVELLTALAIEKGYPEDVLKRDLRSAK
jgi:tetratricopeptide (TPR) repeat protein